MAKISNFKTKQLVASHLEQTVLLNSHNIHITQVVKYIPASVDCRLLYSIKTGLYTTTYKDPSDLAVILVNDLYSMEFISLYLLNVVNCLFIQTYSHGTTTWSMLNMHRAFKIPFINLQIQKKYIDTYKSFCE